MKQIIAIVVIAALSAAFAETQQDQVVASDKKMPAKIPPQQRDGMRRYFGGKIVRPGSQKGKIAFVTTQDEFLETNILDVAKMIMALTPYNISVERAKPGDPATLKMGSKANIAIVIASDEKTPPMLVAPEDGWAVINVKKLHKGLGDDVLSKSIYSTRCRKELIRAYNIVCGGFGSPWKGSVINAAKIEDLDLGSEDIPFDTVQTQTRYLKSLGVTVSEFVSYRQACKEGWAPAPKDEYQKAALQSYLQSKEKKEVAPTNPIRIKPGDKPTSKAK